MILMGSKWSLLEFSSLCHHTRRAAPPLCASARWLPATEQEEEEEGGRRRSQLGPSRGADSWPPLSLSAQLRLAGALRLQTMMEY